MGGQDDEGLSECSAGSQSSKAASSQVQ
jgi:hypothetical protein